MDYMISDSTVNELPVKAVEIDGVTLNLDVETVESRAVRNGGQVDLALQVRVICLDDLGNKTDEGPVVVQTVSGESELRLQVELDNLVERAIKIYMRALAVRQAAASIPARLVGTPVRLVSVAEFTGIMREGAKIPRGGL